MGFNSFASWMFTIFAILLLLGTGAFVLQTLGESQRKNIPTFEVANETTAAAVIADGQAVKEVWVKEITSVHACLGNSSGCLVLPTANYTTSIGGNGEGIVKSATQSGYNNTRWNISYTYYPLNDSRYSIPIKATSGWGKLSDYISILILLGIFGLVISFFLKGRGEDELGGGGEGPGFDIGDGKLTIFRDRGDGGSQGSVRY